jgi:hypothetical protein
MMYVGTPSSFSNRVSAAEATCTLLPAVSARASIVRLLASAAIAPAALGATAEAAQAPTIKAGGCAVVGKPVSLSGSGFAARREYVVSIDGVYFGQSTTRADGSFHSSLRPGGLGAGVAQQIDQLEATDGTSIADTKFTLTRATGARFIAGGGSPGSLTAPFEVWDLSPSGARRRAYLHYVSPAGAARETVALGVTSGQCGYLRTAKRKVFPFTPTIGTWTFQIDTRKAYSPHPGGPVARIEVGVA